MKIGSSIGVFVRRGKIGGSRGKRKSQSRGKLVKEVVKLVKVVERGRKRKKSWGLRRRDARARWKQWRFPKSTEC